MKARPRRTPRTTRVLAAALVSLLLAGLVAVSPTLPAAAQEPAGPTVTVNPASGLDDGVPVTVTIRTTPEVPVYEARARVCRAGVVYQPGTPSAPNEDFALGGPNCPDNPVTTSADLSVSNAATLLDAPTAAGAQFDFRVGSGVVAWGPTSEPNRYSLTCDPDNPCALVVQLYTGAGADVRWQPFVTTLQFGSIDPIAGCGGPADGIVTTGGSDRMTDAWIGWTLASCAATAGGAPTRAVFAGEAEAVLSVANGFADLAYTGLGYHGPTGFVPPSETRRQTVAVPVALNAVVLAVGGGQVDSTGRRPPYRDIRLTNEEFARMIAGGEVGIQALQRAIEARHPEFVSGMFDESASFRVGAAAETSTAAWLATRFLATMKPAAFSVPDIPRFEPNSGRRRPVSSSFSLADPTYQDSVTLFSGRPPLRRALTVLNRQSSGGVWVLTDLATARALNLTVVQIENAAGEAVTPTRPSMLAALGHMAEDEHGVLVPEPAMVGGPDELDPYPMTFVEYALVPTQPLLTQEPSCVTLRPASQALLGGWLEFLAGAGQANLPAGMEPLPDELLAVAATRRGEVGTAPVTGVCAPTEPPLTPPPGTPGAVPGSALPGSGGPGLPGSGGAGGGASLASGAPVDAAAAAAAAGEAATANEVDEEPEAVVAVPAFGGRSASGATVLLLALFAIMVLMSTATVATAGNLRVAGWRPAWASRLPEIHRPAFRLPKLRPPKP